MPSQNISLSSNRERSENDEKDLHQEYEKLVKTGAQVFKSLSELTENL